MQKLTRYLNRTIYTLVVIVLVVYVVRAFDSRRFPDLGPEYRMSFESEFDASQEDETDWQRYLAIEKELALELDTKIVPEERYDSLLDRYADESLTNPDNLEANWNLSYEMTAAHPKGVAVMLHGLSDSPYSMLATAQAGVGSGYNVVVPRMPGHGFAVGGLLDARWEDWTAAVRIAVRHADTLREPGQPLLLAGYSNGALLAIDYALRCEDEGMPCPDRIVMLSPAIAISASAVVANWHSAVSWIPYFEKFQWLSVLPEIDPFKFTSFTKRAAWEIHKIAKRTHKLLKDPVRVAKLPPILTFMSVVDDTVSSEAVVSLLYGRLPENGSDIVVYDVNRNSTIVHLMKRMPANPVDYFKSMAPLNYGVIILRNSASDKEDVVSASLLPGTTDLEIRETGLEWPLGVYSLSHIAIPFSTIDPLYGDGMNSDRTRLVLGAIAPRGERGVLSLSPAYFLRTRNNPFFPFQVRHFDEWDAGID